MRYLVVSSEERDHRPPLRVITRVDQIELGDIAVRAFDNLEDVQLFAIRHMLELELAEPTGEHQ